MESGPTTRATALRARTAAGAAPLLALIAGCGAWAAAQAGPAAAVPFALIGLATVLTALGASRQVARELARLRRIGDRLRAGADAIPDGLAVFDASDRLVFFNTRYPDHLLPSMRGELRLGRRFEDILRSALGDGPLYHADMGADFPARRLAMRARQHSEHEQHLIDGRWLRIRETRTPDGSRVLLTQDITEERRRADALRLLAAAIEQVEDPVEITSAEHVFTYVNPAFERSTGWSHAEAVGRQPQEILASGAHPAGFFADMLETLETGAPWHGTIVNRRRDGRLIEQETTISPLRDAAGTITHFVAVKRDVTEANAQARALAESEARYRAVVETQTEFIVRIGPDGRWTFMNEAAERFVGRSIEDLNAAGHTDRSFVHPDDLARFDAHLARITPENPTDTIEIRGILPDGTVHWEVWTDTGIFDAAGRLVETQCIGRIVDEQKQAEAARDQAEQALAASEARFRTIAESVPVGLLISDLATGRPLFINAMARNQLDLGPEEMPDTMQGNWATLSDRDRLIAELAANGSVGGFEADLVLTGGRRMTALFSATRIDHGGKPALLTATVDITDLRRTQAELEESEARLSAIIAAIPVAMNIARLSDRRLLFVNQPYLDTFGLNGVDLDAFDRDQLYVDTADRDWIYAEIAAGREVTNVDLLLRRTDGTEVATSLTSRPILFQGEPALVTSSVDLTALRDAEAEVARSREALHQSEKLTALGALLAGVAHELNNPLSVVVGYASMLGEFDMEPAMAARIEKIHAAAERCARIVRTFLAMARARPPQRGPVALGAVVEGALELAAYGLRSADVTVVTDLPPDLPAVEGDADQLHQVVINLVVNAQHALADRPQPRRLALSARAEAGCVVLEVADNGPGMDAEVARRAFEPFFTTKPQGVGTGVGLSVCHGIVAAHGGRIELDTAPGDGARFRVHLPRAAAPATTPGEPAASAPAGGRVLVVDDEPEIATLLAERLTAEGLAVRTAASGRAALEALAADPADAVVTDFRMPDMDGAALAAEVARRWPRLAGRVLVVTGDAIGAGANARLKGLGLPVFEKPLDLAALAADLRRRLAVGDAG